MKIIKNIEENIEATFNSIEALEPAKANPFLFTRIEQRMKNKMQLNTYGSLLYKLAVALIIFIAVNVYTYSKFYNTNVVESSTGKGINAFATEYGLQQTADNI